MHKSCEKCLRRMSRKKKRAVKKRFKLFRAWKQFTYSMSDEKPVIAKRKYKFSSSLMKLRNSVRFFYG